jgi:hypothetical protein
MTNAVEKPSKPECDIPSSDPLTIGYNYNNISGTHFYNTSKKIILSRGRYE